MAISVDVAYIISITMPINEKEKIPIFFSGSEPLKGVLKEAPYPNFWIDMSDYNSLFKKEDQLLSTPACSRDAVKEYCETFFEEYKNYIFRPFIYKDKTNTISNPPDGYNEKLITIQKEYRKFKRQTSEKYSEHKSLERGKGMTEEKFNEKKANTIEFINKKIDN
ncbi:hypothetical protein A0U91_10320 [Acetobacter persici]|uniref:Uncharacterized protein n=2 Tax=Acetobacter persici TaxID=1076596 RepID=A0A1U9LFP8_9PROT|nr:hypothetical protein A0U91_10320 [Acetobacter persici]